MEEEQEEKSFWEERRGKKLEGIFMGNGKDGTQKRGRGEGHGTCW